MVEEKITTDAEIAHEELQKNIARAKIGSAKESEATDGISVFNPQKEENYLMSDSIKPQNKNQLSPHTQPAHSGNGQVTVNQKVNCYPIRPRTFNGKEYFAAADIAKILGVAKKTVLQWNNELWHGAQWFTADIKTHDGVYLYEIERVEQLKSVYRPDWHKQPVLRSDAHPAPVQKHYITKEEREKIRNAVRMVDPDTVAVKIGLKAAKRGGYICPECNNGSGSDGTGIMPKFLSQKGDHLEWYCFVCGGTWDNISLAAKFALNYSVNDKGQFTDAKDFPKALEQVATLFGISIDESGTVHSPHAAAKPEIFDDADDDIDESELKDYSRFYSFAASGLKNFMNRHDGFYRGIPKNVYEYFWCGHVDEFGKAHTPAFIVPASPYSFLARFTGNEDELTDEQKDVLRPKWHSSAPKPVFNYKRAIESNDPIIFVHEGEFDVMSTYFASIREEFIKANGIVSLSKIPHVNAVALMGTEVTRKHARRLKADEIGKKFFVVMLDNDAAGIKKTPKVIDALKALGHDAIGVLLSEKYNDANEFLKAEPENFSARIKEIYDAAQAGTLTDDEVFSVPADAKHTEICAQEPEINAETPADDKQAAQIERWQKENGIIDANLLSDLKSAAVRIDSLEKITALDAEDVTNQKYLGHFKYYSFFGATYQNFLQRLRSAKTAAQAKVRAWRKDNSQPEPTADENALAALNVSRIEQKIETCFNHAKKTHAKYVEAARAKEIDAQREAERASYIEAPPTTQGEVENCPVNLYLPEGVIFNEDGVKMRVPSKQNSDEPLILEACQNLIVPAKVFHEESTHMTKYQTVFKVGHVWRKKIFDGRTLQDPRAISELCNYGVHITDPRLLAKYFAMMIALNEQKNRLEEIHSYAMPGWQDDDCKVFAYPPDTDDYHVERSGVDYESIFKVRGNREEWRKFFRKILPYEARKTTFTEQKRLVAFAVGACLVAPMLKVIKAKNIQINFWGTSNLAKTPLPKIGLSVFGDPSEGKMFRTWGGTPKNRLAMAAAFCDFPQLLDEGETMNKKAELEKSEAIYDFFTGLINQANKRNGDVRKAETFRSVRFSTAEKPMLSSKDKRGAFKRVIDVHVKKAVFNDTDARKVHLFVESNHGHFGREWIDYISENALTIREDFETLCDNFKDSGFVRENRLVRFDSVDETNARSVIACFVAFYHFLVCLGEAETFDEISAASLAGDQLAELPTVEEISDVNRAIELLASWVMENPKRFETPKKYEDGSPIKDEFFHAESNAPSAGKKFPDGRIGFYQNAFRNIVEDDLKLPSYEKFLSDLFDAGFLDCKDSRNKTKQVRVDGVRAKMYVINAGVLYQPVTADDEDDYEDEL